MIFGFTFKENCLDARNSKVIDIVSGLQSFHMIPIIYDPCAKREKVVPEYGIDIFNHLPEYFFDSAVLVVAHKEFVDLDLREHVGTVII